MICIKIRFLAAIFLTILAIGIFPISVYASSQSEVVLGNSYTLESGKTLNDDLFILGGNVNLMSGSTINGSVVLIGGVVQADGTVNGDFAVLGGTLNLGPAFILNGNLTTAGTVVNRDPAAQIKGQVNTNVNAPYITLPLGVRIPYLGNTADPFFKMVGFFLRLFLWALAAMLAAMFLPVHLNRISQTALSQPLISGGLGILTTLILPILFVLLAITICLIPVALLGVLALVIAWAFGMVALGFEVGKRISAAVGREWHPAISGGLGMLLLMTILNGMQSLVPCVGWIPKVLAGFLGLGAVLLTQFGTKPYISNPSPPAANPGNPLPS